jgi:hypothetical protein
VTVALVAGAPVSIPELIDALADRFGGCVDAKRISDVLRYQVGLGRVRRLERGVYEIEPGVLPRSTASHPCAGRWGKRLAGHEGGGLG